MLLRHTPVEVAEREALTINPAKTCQPIGAMYAALGIHGCLPHSHGSQGCCAYHRSALSRHYKEPIMAATSSFTEGASVFGGQSNLLAAVETIFAVYNPDIVAVHSTCLSETIGDDLNQICQAARDSGKVPDGKHILFTNTPSYVGSHVTGFSNMVRSMAAYFAAPTGIKQNQVNIIPGWVEPADMREIKRLAGIMAVPCVMFPDTSDVLDAPQTGEHVFYPKGGVTIPELESIGDSRATLALGPFASENAALWLDAHCKVPGTTLDLPIGIRATDRFIMELARVSGRPVPEEIEDERGRLVDIITDMQQYFHGKRVALYGDPDQLMALSEFLLDLEMKPVYVVSGTPGTRFATRMQELLGEEVPEAKVQNGERADMFLLHQWIKNAPVDLLIGNTYGKYIARDEGIPFVRMGFPIMDRIGHTYFPTVGYAGGMRLLEKMLNAMLDHYDATCPEAKFELVM